MGGDNSSGLQAALNAPGDVLISGASCNINREVDVPSDKNIQCTSLNVTLINPNTDGSTSMFLFDNVTNSSISNCTLQGAQVVLPPTYPNGEAFNFLVIIGGYTGKSTNLTFVDNQFVHPYGQAAIEAYWVTGNLAATVGHQHQLQQLQLLRALRSELRQRGEFSYRPQLLK